VIPRLVGYLMPSKFIRYKHESGRNGRRYCLILAWLSTKHEKRKKTVRREKRKEKRHFADEAGHRHRRNQHC
jgi:hypothetical protein